MHSWLGDSDYHHQLASSGSAVCWDRVQIIHYNDVIMSAMAYQITSLTIVYSTVYSGADQRKHQNSASVAFVMGIHRSPVNSQHKGPVMWKMFPFDDVIMLVVWMCLELIYRVECYILSSKDRWCIELFATVSFFLTLVVQNIFACSIISRHRSWHL